MTESHPIGTYIRRFLLEYVVNDRCLSRNTQKSYRDTIRLLLQFLSQFYSCDATQLTVEQVTADAVRSFLTHRQKQNGSNSQSTSRNNPFLDSLCCTPDPRAARPCHPSPKHPTTASGSKANALP